MTTLNVNEMLLERSERVYHRPECFWSALVNKVRTDVKLSMVSENTEQIVEVHSVFLIAASPYFEELLANVEITKSKIRVEIPDIQYATVLCVIKYIYTGEFRFSGAESLIRGIHACDRFQMTDLQNKCKSELDNHLANHPQDGIIVLDNRALLGPFEHEFMNKSKELIQPNLPQILRSPEIANVSFELMESLLHIHNSEATEEDYFEMLNRWTEASCARKGIEATGIAKRDMCAGLHFNVRFHNINQQYFVENVSNSGFLTEKEIVLLFYYYSFPKDHRPLPCKIISRQEEQISANVNDIPRITEIVRGVVSSVWIRKWFNYVENNDKINFPGTITNSDIIEEKRTNRLRNTDYVHIKWEDYLFLINKYGVDIQFVDDVLLVNNNVAEMKNEPHLPIYEFNSDAGDNRSIGQPIEFKVPINGSYRIKAGGAKGGNSLSEKVGGFGATKEATYKLNRGDILSMVIGKAGGDSTHAQCGSGGGGGTFVSLAGNLILAAGGGGGAYPNGPGCSGVDGINGTASSGSSYPGPGGQNGMPGQTCTSYGHPCGGAGAGWLGQSSVPSMQNNIKHSQFGKSKNNNWLGGMGTHSYGGTGGYGGGGEGGVSIVGGYIGGGGGGGGYSGGGAGSYTSGGGGGGSFASGQTPSGLNGGNKENNGFVSITFVSP